jgi:hypothetical protein
VRCVTTAQRTSILARGFSAVAEAHPALRFAPRRHQVIQA